jgi:hypothetical protein
MEGLAAMIMSGTALFFAVAGVIDKIFSMRKSGRTQYAYPLVGFYGCEPSAEMQAKVVTVGTKREAKKWRDRRPVFWVSKVREELKSCDYIVVANYTPQLKEVLRDSEEYHSLMERIGIAAELYRDL